MKKIKIFLLLSIFYPNIALLSQNDEFILTSRIIGSPQSSNEPGMISYNILKDDKIHYSVNTFLEYDIPFPKAEIFRDGKLLLIRSFNNKYEIYDNGNLINEFKIPERSINNERSVFSSVYNEEAVLLISEPDSNFLTFYRVNSNGVFLSEKNIKGSNATGIFRANQEQILLSHFSWEDDKIIPNSCILNQNGEIIKEFPIMFDKITYDDDLTKAIIFNNQEYSIIDLEKLELLHSGKAEKNEMIYDCKISGDRIAVLSTSFPVFTNKDWKYQDARLQIKNIISAELLEERISSDSFNKAELHFDSDEPRIILDTEK